jgi:hypothetical protein
MPTPSPTYPELLARYRRKHGDFVEPTQGFASLHQSLWLAYSMGRHRGFTDLGTYNPASRLPSGAPSDHAVYPARAFDLGRKDRFLFRGWYYLKARRLAKLYWRHHQALAIEYVILGHRIISRRHPTWRYYADPDGSHSFHIHVSGHWPGRV